MSILTEIHSIFVLLLALFTLAATFLALYSIGNAVRLRNVRMSWNSGKLAGYPLFSTLFARVSRKIPIEYGSITLNLKVVAFVWRTRGPGEIIDSISKSSI